MTPSTASTAELSRERGSAPVEFVLVSVLLLVLVLGIVQLAISLHVRNTLVASAAEGARYAANADRDLGDGEERTREVIGDALGADFAQDVTASYDELDGAQVVTVEVRATLPLFGFLGPSRALVVTGHALEEGAP